MVSEPEVYAHLGRIKEICREKKFAGNFNYAYPYADAGLTMTGYELAVQVLYVLSNIQRWTGEEARRVKHQLNQFASKEMKAR